MSLNPQPLRVRLPDGPQPSADRRLGPPEPRAAMLRNPAPPALATRALPIAWVLSARRTSRPVGSRIWVNPTTGPHPTQSGLTP